MTEDQKRAEINRLYWGSDSSVGEIAERLGVSRRAMYDSIDPQPVGASCPDCGAELGFRNRTAAERGEATCVACGREEAVSGATAKSVSDAADRSATGARAVEIGEEPEVERLARGARLSPMPPRSVPGAATGTVLGGALVAGLAAGAALGYLIRRR